MMSGGHVLWMISLWLFVAGTLASLAWLVAVRWPRLSRERVAADGLAERFIEGEIDDDEYWERMAILRERSTEEF